MVGRQQDLEVKRTRKLDLRWFFHFFPYHHLSARLVLELGQLAIEDLLDQVDLHLFLTHLALSQHLLAVRDYLATVASQLRVLVELVKLLHTTLMMSLGGLSAQLHFST